jgi:hypothetical protein
MTIRKRITSTSTRTSTSTQTTVAASPGYELAISTKTAKGKTAVRRFPIIAWKIDGAVATPITPYNTKLSNEIARVVIGPSGAVYNALTGRRIEI